MTRVEWITDPSLYNIAVFYSKSLATRKSSRYLPKTTRLYAGIFDNPQNGRNAMKCQCSECGITKFTFVKGKHGQGIGSSLAELAVEGAIKAAPYLAKKAFSSARNMAADAVRDPKLQQKAVNYAL